MAKNIRSHKAAPRSTGRKISSQITGATRRVPATNNSPAAAANLDAQAKEAFSQYNNALDQYHNNDPSLRFLKNNNFDIASESENIFEDNEQSNSKISFLRKVRGSASGSKTGTNNQSGLNQRKYNRYALETSPLFNFGASETSDSSSNSYATSSSSSSSGRKVRGSSSAVKNYLSGGNANQPVDVEKYTETYLKENAPSLYEKFVNNPQFKNQYLSNLSKLYNGLDVKTIGEAPVAEKTITLDRIASKAGQRDRLQVANAYMTLIGNDNKLVDQVSQSGLQVFLADSIVSQGENVAGYFSTENHMVLARNPSFASFNATAAHELAHVIDNLDGDLNGFVDGLSHNWTQLREAAINKIISSGANLEGLDPGFLSYATSDDTEFLAVMNQLYQSDSNDLLRHFPEIFNTLDVAFRTA